MAFVKYHRDLKVYQLAFESAMQIFHISQKFPREERYSLTDQIRRSSRSVCGNISEGWRKRRYKKLFVNKLTDADGEATETQNWLDFAFACGYISKEEYEHLNDRYNQILAMLTSMIVNSDKWTINNEGPSNAL